MQSTVISFDNDFQEKVLAGVTKLAKVVGSTMGPMGSNVVINRAGHVHCTKDGVTACRAVNSKDNYEAIGINLVREASEKTNSTVGDGTSGTCVLAASIYANGLKHLAFGANGIQIRNGITKAANKAVEIVRGFSQEIKGQEDIYRIAKISSNHSDEIAKILSDVFSKIGENGTIKVETGNTTSIESKIVEGMQFDNGYLSPYFITNEKMEADLEKPYIFLVNKKISNVSDMIKALQALVKTGKPILIIADEIEGDALSTIVYNKLKGLQVCVVRSPSYGNNRKNMLQDIAILTGGQVIGEDTGILLENVTLENGILGRANRVIITKETTTIIGGLGNKDEIQKRINQLKEQIYNSKDDYELKKMQERLAKLDGGVGIISVGAKTESELMEKKDLVDDAFCACKAAIAGGIVPGGGLALLRTKEILENCNIEEMTPDEYTGFRIFLDSLDQPIRNILENAGLSPELIMEKLSASDKGFGYDVLSKKIVDMVGEGIIDPTNVVVAEIENASSIAGLMLTTKASIVEEVEKDKPQEAAPMMPPMM